jgi:hypothetical protein
MARYTNIPIITSLNKKQIYQTVRYPEIPRSESDIYVYTTVGDRYDTLALQYYGNSSLWWVISNANGNLSKDSLTPPIGSQIRIPSNQTLTEVAYKDINQQSSTSESSTSLGSSTTSGGGGY